MTDDEKEREYCRIEVYRCLPNEQTQPKWCVDLLLRERAAARAEGHVHTSTCAFQDLEITELKAENERLRGIICADRKADAEDQAVYRELQTKHTALVKAARAVYAMCQHTDTKRGEGLEMALPALRDALKGEP
jgi:hypothetical protein